MVAIHCYLKRDTDKVWKFHMNNSSITHHPPASSAP